MAARAARAHDVPMSDEPTSTSTHDRTPDGPDRDATSRRGGGEGNRPRRLTRSRSQRIVGGVAGGLGEYFGVDPVVFRIGFVLLALMGGTGIFVYVIGWLAVPEEGHRRSVGQHMIRRGWSAQVLGVTLISVAAIMILREQIDLDGDVPVSLALLAAGGFLLLYNPSGDRTGDRTRFGIGGWSDDSAATAGAPPVGGAPVPPGSTETRPIGAAPVLPATAVGAFPPPPAPPVPPAPPPPPVPPEPPRGAAPRPRSRLTRATLGAMLLVVGAIGLLDAAEAFDIRGEAYLIAALFVSAAGLVIGAWWGRSRWLIVVGTALTVVLAIAGAVDVPLRGGFGLRIHIPDDLTEVDRGHHLIAGEIRLDYGRVDFRGEVTRIEATVGFGEVRVVLPDNVRVIVTAKVGAGEISALGTEDHGIDARVRQTAGPRGVGLVRLDVEVGAGEITVVREETSRGTA